MAGSMPPNPGCHIAICASILGAFGVSVQLGPPLTPVHGLTKFNNGNDNCYVR